MKRLALLLSLLLWAPCAHAAIGAPTKLGTFSLTANPLITVAVTTGTNSAVGNLIVCAVTWEVGSLSDHVTVASDTASNTYTVDTHYTNVGDVNVQLIYIANAAALGSGGTITATFNAVQSFRSMACYSISGIATSTPRDISQSSVATGTAPSVAMGTLGQADEIILTAGSVFLGGPDSFTEDAAFTTLDTLTGGGGTHTAYKIVATTTGPTYAPTLGTSREFVFSGTSFKGAAAAGAAPHAMMTGMGP